MNKKSAVAQAVKTVMLTGVFGGVFFTGASSAQDNTAESNEAGKVERIEVTGSRIKRTDMEGVAPVTVISAEEIEKSGFTSVEEILQASVANAGRTVEGNESSWTQGASTINLRGMGANRTLVLVNGKRVPQYPAATGGTTNFVNTSTFPTSAVERVEILTGGASAIYGSDAVGGVVNIILKKSYDGSSLDVRYENPQHGGADRQRATYTGGFETKLGQTVLVVEYANDEILRAGQREMTRVGGPDGTDTYSSTSAYLRDYDKTFHNIGVSGSSASYIMANQQQCAELFGERGIWNDAESRYKCRFDTVSDDGLHTGKEEFNLVLSQHGDLTDNWQYSVLLQGSDKTTKRGNGQKSISPYIYMDADNPGTYSYDAAEFANSREFRVYRRLDDYGQIRDYTGKEKNFNGSIGVNGSVGEYELELNWAYGKSSFNRIGRNQMRADRLLDVISFDPADSANPEKWYPLDKMTPEQVQYLYAETLTDADSGMNQFSAVLTGDLIELPAGPVQFAASAEWARDWYSDIKDADTLSGNLLGQGGTQGRGSRKRYAAAGELAIPVLDRGSDWGGLDASVALRYDKYDDKSNVGGAFTPQAGLVYRPNESWLLRANLGRSFRAPDLHRMYAGVSRSFGETRRRVDINHPIDLDDSYESISAGNLDLTEEKGKFWNLGAVAELTDNISASLDFWNIELRGAVYTESVDRILDNPAYDMTGVAANCNELDTLGYIMQQPSGQAYKDLLCVRRGIINSAYEASRGIDGEVSYSLDLDTLGSLKFTAAASYTLEKEYQAFAGGEVVEETKDDYLPKWKGNLSARWNYGDLSMNLAWYYLGTGEGRDLWELVDAEGEEYEDYVHSKLAPFKRINFNTSYRFNSSNKLTLGINNLADEKPPVYVPGHPERNEHPYYPTSSGYNILGRTFYASYELRF